MQSCGRLASTYLFVGPAGIGKRTLATSLAQALLCDTHTAGTLQVCGTCQSCRLVQAGNHPDLLTVELPEGKSTLPIDLFIGDREHRHKDGLCHQIALKPFMGRYKIAIVDDADYFSRESANCLLKTLEEPPSHSLLILIGTSENRLLPTIRSRAQTVRFSPLSEAHVAAVLLERGIVESPDEAHRLAARSEGSIRRASELAGGAGDEFRAELIRCLESPRVDVSRVAQRVLDEVNQAGKEAAIRRNRLKEVIQIAIDFYRQTMRESAASGSNSGRAANLLDRCLVAQEQADRNANQSSLIYAWADDLSRWGCQDA